MAKAKAPEEPRWVRMDLKEFYDNGLLAHVNQTAFWPLGLALTIRLDDGKPKDLFVQKIMPYDAIVAGDGDEEAAKRADRFAAWLKRRVRRG
jgi:hypothetical protein